MGGRLSWGGETGVPFEAVEYQISRSVEGHHPYHGPAFTEADAKGWYVRGLISLEELERAIDIAIERGWA